MTSNLVFEPDPEKRAGFEFALPATFGGAPLLHSATWPQWAAFHAALGQELAKRMRVYPGPATDPDGGDIGGTPAAMPARMAA